MRSIWMLFATVLRSVGVCTVADDVVVRRPFDASLAGLLFYVVLLRARIPGSNNSLGSTLTSLKGSVHRRCALNCLPNSTAPYNSCETWSLLFSGCSNRPIHPSMDIHVATGLYYSMYSILWLSTPSLVRMSEYYTHQRAPCRSIVERTAKIYGSSVRHPSNRR